MTELQCIHGVGHKVDTHGCDGCCSVFDKATEERIIKLLEETVDVYLADKLLVEAAIVANNIALIKEKNNQHVRAETTIFTGSTLPISHFSARSHGIDDELDYSDSVVIKITKVSYLGEPSHWEFDMVNADWEDIASGTAPTFHGVVDMAIETARNRNDLDDPEWSRFDANERNK